MNLRALKKAQDESNRKNWTLTGSGELVRAMQGNKLLEALSHSIVTHLVKYVDGILGAIYVTETDGRRRHFIGSY
jgi:hypothetical protein